MARNSRTGRNTGLSPVMIGTRSRYADWAAAFRDSSDMLSGIFHDLRCDLVDLARSLVMERKGPSK